MDFRFGALPCDPSQAGGRADFIGGQRNWVSQVAVVGDPQIRILGILDSQYIYVYIYIYHDHDHDGGVGLQACAIYIYVFVVSMLQPSLLPSGGHFVAPLSRQGNPNAQHVPWEKKQPMG
jgi:hypothetical protein